MQLAAVSAAATRPSAQSSAPDLPVDVAAEVVSCNLTALKSMTVGGPGDAGGAAARDAAALLATTGAIVQQAHQRGLDEAKTMSPELEANLINLSKHLALTAAKTVQSGSSAAPVSVGELLGQTPKQADDILGSLAYHVAKFGSSASPEVSGYV